MQIAETIKRFLRWSKLMPVITAINNFRCLLIKKWALLLKKNPLEAVYDDAFFSVARHEAVLKDTPRILAEIVQGLFHPASVVDFGCGCAIYLRELSKLGVEVFGVDGSPAALRNLSIDKSKFLLQDLTQRFSLPRRYDVALCFEVAEHIPTNTSATLVDNITAGSDTVVFTGAHKGQGGHDHVNEQEPQFWIDLFAKKGFVLLKDETEKARRALTERGAIFWLAENVLIFKKAV